MHWLWALLILTAGSLGVALAFLGLPGIWFLILLGAGVQFLAPETYSWATLAVCVGFAVIAEIVELLSGVAGAKRAGSSRRAAAGALIGGLAGGILGAWAPPVLGAILWSAVGAGVGAVVAEMTLPDRRVDQVSRIGQSAAMGRLVGSLVKGGLGVVVWITLIVAAVIR